MRTIRSITAILLGVVAGSALGWAQAKHLDAALFGSPLAEKDSMGVEWSESRRIQRVEISFAPSGGALPAPDSMQVQYWHRVWDGVAIRRYGEKNAGRTGWVANDDWFNGEWRTSDTRAQTAGRKVIFTFAPSNEKEFPKMKSPGVTYRPTLRVRVKFSGPHPPVARFSAFSDSVWQAPERIRVQFEKREQCNDPIEVYNGWLVKDSNSASRQGRVCILEATIAHVRNWEDSEADRTIVTLRSPSYPFSFAMDEVMRGDRIYVKDFGALVTRAFDPVTISGHRATLEQLGAKTVYDRVTEQREQTLERAWKDMPLKRSYYFILGMEGGRQRFRLNPTGELWVHRPNFSDKRPGKDNGHFLWPDGLTYQFGLPASQFAERTLAEGCLPMVTTRWLDGPLAYEQEAFADVLAANSSSAPPMAGDDPTVAIMAIRIVNTSGDRQVGRLRFSTYMAVRDSEDTKKFETLEVRGDEILGSFEGRPVLRFLADTRGAGKLENSPEGVNYAIALGPHEEHTLYLKIPFITLTQASEIEHLRALSPEREREAVARFWRSRVSAGTEILTPEPWLNDFYKAHLTHLLINNEREIGADRYMARVGSFFYGAFSNESIMMITDLDRRGYKAEAERSLELFLHYQGTVPLPGQFSTKKGILYGAGGYEHGDYNQHHGWTLWGLAEHYWYTRDRAWMERAAPHLIDAAQWIANERKATMKRDAQGRPVSEYGMLPAGSLEDVTDFWYWLSTNTFSWWGLDNAARALRAFGHPQGADLVKESESYRQDLLRAFREASVRAPVVALRDGTYVPHTPSNVHTRGRSHGWLRETLEGSIMLPITRLMDPNSREAEWILKDYEDNRYISDRFGYSIPVFDQFWFSRGGFSMQPNLLHGPLPYLYRDQIEHFLRAYFNGFASSYDPSVRMLCEHPLPELGYIVGDHFKSSDEAQSTYWLRLMFISELDETLHLGRAIPRDWLRDGETVAIKNASTYFGTLNFEIRSQAGKGRIEAFVDPPARNSPKAIVVRLRHPENKAIRRVSINGTSWTDFDAQRGDIRLPGNYGERIKIVAEY